MKLRESGMPEESYWESLFNVELILDALHINAAISDVAELGCGYGTLSIPVAQRIRGKLQTFDIDPRMIDRTRQRAAESGLQNIECIERDVFEEGFGLPDGSQDVCLLFNILHCESPLRLLTEAARITKASGVVDIIHWRYDETTPRGPALEIRPRPEQIAEWAMLTGELMNDGQPLDLPPWHFGYRFIRCTSPIISGST